MLNIFNIPNSLPFAFSHIKMDFYSCFICLLLCNIVSGAIAYADDGNVEDSKNKYYLLKKVPEQYKQYDVPPWQLLKLRDFKKAYSNAFQSENKQYMSLSPFIAKLHVVWNPSMTKACFTPTGIALIYDGYKPHLTSDGLRIIYYPQSNKIAIRIRDQVLEYQSGEFGSLDQATKGILDGELCTNGER